MKNYPKRYIPETLDNWFKTHTHIHIKWNKDLSTDIISLDYDGLVIACDTVLRVAGSRDINKNNFCEIQKDIFFKILNNNYTNYIDYLVENKILFTDNKYVVGEKSISYKLNEDFIDTLKSISIDNKLFNKRTLNSIKSNSKLTISKYHINNYKSSFKIDYDKAIEHIIYVYHHQIKDHKGRVLNKYTKMLLEHKILQISEGQLWINRSDTNGRVNSNLTTLNSDMKQFILGYDYTVDIKNSQPLLLSLFIDYVSGLNGQLNNSNSSFSGVYNLSLTLLSSYVYKIMIKNLCKSDVVRLTEELKSIKLPSKIEIEKWKNLCEKGMIYEYFQKEIYEKLGKKLTRQEVKDLIIVNMYSSNHNNNEYKKLFAFIFPTIFNFISKVKSIVKEKRRHRIFPILLQGIESYMMVEKVLPKLDKMKIKYLFIHDGLVVKEKDIDDVQLMIMQEFNYLKVNPSFSVEKLRK